MAELHEEKLSSLSGLLKLAGYQFAKIRMDWSDPRYQIQLGIQAVEEALSLLGEPDYKIYSHMKKFEIEEDNDE